MVELKSQRGAALVLVLALVVILIILGFAAMSVADNQTIMVNRHQQREKALHYAEAGVHRYMAELNKDFEYYSTPASDDMETDTGFEFEEGFYRLEVDEPTSESPYVTIRSTGWVKNSDITRTVDVRLEKRSFLKNLITANIGSDRLWYTNRFMRGDVINGSLHMNGDLVIDGFHGDGQVGPIFKGPVTYSGSLTEIRAAGEALNVIDILDWIPDLESTTQFLAGKPLKVERVAVPSSNENLKGKADHVFKGRTCIHIENSSLKVKDKDGNVTTITIPQDDDGLVIYVKGGTGNNKWSKETANVFVSGVLDGRLTIAAENDIYITANDPTIWTNPGTTPATTGGVTYASVSSEGSIDADDIAALMNSDDMLGLMANRNVRILHYNWPASAGSWYGGNTLVNWIDVAPTDMNIHASICAATGSFEYEEHKNGSAKGNLTVIGSITQYTLGPIAGYAENLIDLPLEHDLLHTRDSGYGKNYWHDPRLMYDTPPDFLEPSNSGWEIIEWREVSNP